MPEPLSRKDLLTVRTDALHLAASFYNEFVPELSELWKLASFFEAFMTEGGEALREQYAPPNPKTIAPVLKLAKNWDVV